MTAKKKNVSFCLLITLALALLLSIPGYASAGEFGNEWVYDEAQVVSVETEDYIKALNETVFTTYKNKPQLAFVVINDLPYNINDYKLDLFNDFGVGTAEENRGMLFVFAINDREYALEIGDGFERGSLLRKDLETDFITEDMKNSLRTGDYDSVVLQVAQHLEGIMADEEAGVYTQKEAEKLAEQKAREEQLAAAQKKLEEQAAAIREGLVRIGIVFCIICPAAGLIVLAVHLIKKQLRQKKIKELINSHYKYISMVQTNEDEFTQYLNSMYPHISRTELEEEFLDLLHIYYLGVQMDTLDKTAPVREHLPLYKDALRETNNLQAFKSCQLTSLASITHKVDETERQKAEMQKRNAEIIDQFLNENKNRIVHEDMLHDICDKLRDAHMYPDRLVSEKELEESFVGLLNILNFQWEVDKFINENSDQAHGQYFNRDTFYRELTNSEHYQNYRYNSHYDRSWMYPLLVMHVARRREEHQEELRRQEEERRARERRRQEEAARMAMERMRSNNSSFGGGFKGGSSSGGGFKGGW